MWAIILGVCDANMALLTVTSLDHLQKDGVFLLNKVNENPMVTLALLLCDAAIADGGCILLCK